MRRTLIRMALMGLCLAPVQVVAQADPFTAPSGADGRIHLTVTVARAGTPTMMLRTVGAGPRNVILVDPATLTPESLSNAVAGLLIAEAMDPDGRRRSDRTAQRTALSQPAPVYPWAQEAVRRLRRLTDAPGQGNGPRSLQVWVAPMKRVNP